MNQQHWRLRYLTLSFRLTSLTWSCSAPASRMYLSVRFIGAGISFSSDAASEDDADIARRASNIEASVSQ